PCDHVLLRSFPTRRSSDLAVPLRGDLVGSVRHAGGTAASGKQQSLEEFRIGERNPPDVQASEEGRGVEPLGRLVPDHPHALEEIDRKSTRLNSSHVKISYA